MEQEQAGGAGRAGPRPLQLPGGGRQARVPAAGLPPAQPGHHRLPHRRGLVPPGHRHRPGIDVGNACLWLFTKIIMIINNIVCSLDFFQ